MEREIELAVLAGLLSHWLLFIRGEWERHTPVLAVAVFLAALLLLAGLLFVQGLPVRDALASFSLLCFVHLATLFSSIALYRLCFHPLARFPGPIFARLSGFWSVAKSLPKFQLHREVQRLHRRHGDFVRLRPREISINHVAAVRDVHGPGSICLKGPFYDLNLPSRSLQMTRDQAFHTRRRRTWDRGFSPRALSEYEPRVFKHCADLAARLTNLAGRPVDVGRWSKYFGFDVMGDLSFGRSFDMLSSDSPHFIFGMMAASKPVVGTLISVPWLFILFQRLPGISAVRANWISWCADQVEERKRLGTAPPDLFSYILGAGLDELTSSGDLTYDAELAIVAGSETTALCLTTVLYLIARHPTYKKALQAEIDPLVPVIDQLSYQRLAASCPVLDGCINEALRLYPPVPSGVQRLTPPQGAFIADRWIPGDTIVSTPTYSIHRDSRYFVKPEQFIPERWSSRPELIIHKDAFNPFLVGRYSCAGRPLAMMEMRMLLAILIRRFDFNFPKDSCTAESLLDSPEGFRDYFTADLPPVNLVFTTRSPDIPSNN